MRTGDPAHGRRRSPAGHEDGLGGLHDADVGGPHRPHGADAVRDVLVEEHREPGGAAAGAGAAADRLGAWATEKARERDALPGETSDPRKLELRRLVPERRDQFARRLVPLASDAETAVDDFLELDADVAAAVDMNIVMTGAGRYVEVQGTGEEATFTDRELSTLLSLSRAGISQLVGLQKQTLAKHWPL